MLQKLKEHAANGSVDQPLFLWCSGVWLLQLFLFCVTSGRFNPFSVEGARVKYYPLTGRRLVRGDWCFRCGLHSRRCVFCLYVQTGGKVGTLFLWRKSETCPNLQDAAVAGCLQKVKLFWLVARAGTRLGVNSACAVPLGGNSSQRLEAAGFTVGGFRSDVLLMSRETVVVRRSS